MTFYVKVYNVNWNICYFCINFKRLCERVGLKLWDIDFVDYMRFKQFR